MAKERIKGVSRAKTGGRIKEPKSPADHNKDPILFSLERCQPGDHCFSTLDQEHQAAFGNAIFGRKSMTWDELRHGGRHGVGYEKIATNAINAPLPNIITEDQKTLIAFRFKGKAPMVGFRLRNIFYVVWFDSKFTLYQHS